MRGKEGKWRKVKGKEGKCKEIEGQGRKMEANGGKWKGKEGKWKERQAIEGQLRKSLPSEEKWKAKQGKSESKAGKGDERPFGRMYVVALLDHRMCAEQCEGIYLITSGWLGGYLWMLSIDGFCNGCALAHMKMQSMISFKVC